MQDDVQATDITIVGSSLTAALVAAQLSQSHKMKVALVMDTSIPFRATISDALCFPLFLTPDVWHCAQNGREDALNLCRQVGGRRAVSIYDVSLACISSYGAESLDHLAQLASLFGIESEQKQSKLISGALAARTFRGISKIDGSRFWRGLATKFEEWNIPILNMRSSEINFAGKGAAVISNSNAKLETQSVVFVDDGILHFADPETIASDFQVKTQTSLVYKDRMFKSGALIVPEMGMTLSRGNSGTWNATLGASRRDSIDGLSAYFRGFKADRVMAMRRQNQLSHLSNFPYFENLPNANAKAICGFDNFGAFCAPMLARWASGNLTSDDQDFSKAARFNHEIGNSADLHYSSIFSEDAKL